MFRKGFWLGLVALGTVLAGGCVPSGTPAIGAVLPPGAQQGIVVSGEGSVFVSPDVALVTLGVETEDKDLAPAQKMATERMQAIQEAMRAQGVAAKDIKTVRFAISPITEYDGRRQVRRGYRVTHIVQAKIRELDKAGKILDAAVSAGANQVQGISFTVEDPKPYREQARQEAIAEAAAKATQLAKLSGVKLGKPLTINESSVSFRPPIPYLAMEAPAARGGEAPVPISPGETEVRVTVDITYKIE